MNHKVVSAAEAASKVSDGAFIAISGIGVTGTALEVLDAIVERHKKEGHPENLSLIHAGGNQLGQAFAAEGMLGTYYAGLPGLGDFTDGNKVATYTLSQGICTQLYRAQASDVPYLSKAGVHTYLDPRIEASAANEKARERSIVDVVTIGGEEYLHYKLPPITAAVIRGTSADAEGNLTNEEECFKHELLYLAMAAHNNGGIVIAQVKNLAAPGSLHAADIKVPGMLVDYVVVASDIEKWHPQSSLGFERNSVFTPGISGYERVDESVIPLESWAPEGERLIVARRAAAELRPGDICNVGIGMPVGTAYVAAKEGIQDMFHMTVECGAIGGTTGGGFFFGTAFNARAFLQHHEMFDFYNGHGLDIAFLGAAEVGEDGSVNVTRIAGRTHGSGGFVNISGCTKKLVFLTSLTGGGKCLFEDGVLKIVKEGKPVKFVKKVDQISFNGREAVRKGQDVTYLTERAVFRLIDGKVTLVEVAPGLDIEKDILALMNFRPEISPDLKPMPAFCFTKEPIGLKAQWEKILALHSA